MTPEQRYTFDLDGFLHVRNVLSPDELREAKQAAYAYTDALVSGEPLPDGFATQSGTVLGNGFAFHPSLAQLAVHPTVLPIIRELCGGKPQLRRGSLLWDHPTLSGSDGVPLHSGREDYPENYGGPRFPHQWFYAEGDELRCPDFAVFPYLDTIHPGDGGLLIAPGSHKAMFARPHSLFGSFGGNNRKSGLHSYGGLKEGEQPRTFSMATPPGLINVCPSAGDFVIMPESTTHGVLPWSGKGERHALVLRYKPYAGGHPSALSGALEEQLPKEVKLLRHGRL